ncbi:MULTISPECIES: hypothetical protein [Luteococcus]|uniref:Uncharacterized protein n=1 Tax=Luteococcus sanguinis TaxID=174038 RepID=A0ABW1X6D9_9ACTN
MTSPTLVKTDSRSRVVLPGRPDTPYLLEELEDGVLILQPAVVMSKAQAEYNADAELRTLLRDATASETVHRSRQRRH